MQRRPIDLDQAAAAIGRRLRCAPARADGWGPPSVPELLDRIEAVLKDGRRTSR